jgi:hypothetical protein
LQIQGMLNAQRLMNAPNQHVHDQAGLRGA